MGIYANAIRAVQRMSRPAKVYSKDLTEVHTAK